ncbi:MAG: UDP-N-acetylmuramoyl-L-alanyl-D-glutamate--2,6-diaminopimelate ligase [Pseudohongiellaceae bacterium]
MTTAEKIVNKKTTLQSLLKGMLQEGVGDPAMLSVPVSGMSMDSRQLRQGDLFIACFGRNHDARDYIDMAIANGATAVLAQAGGEWRDSMWRGPVPVLVLDNLTAQISHLAARFYGEPGAQLTVTGVTGTNGKTSCTQFLAQALTKLEEPCGVIGTLGAGVYPSLDDTGYTTPGPVDVQHHLHEFLSRGAGHAVIEASSQGLHQHRLAAVPFRAAIFTNLTRDHLDYHDSMDAYGDAKKRLFLGEALRTAVVNADDPYGITILDALSPQVRALTYSVSGARADVSVPRLEYLPAGYRAELSTPWGAAQLEGNLLGQFNISNMLAVLCALMTMPARNASEPDFSRIIQVLAALKPVSGRMEVVGQAAGVTAVVDYAHTPDALKSALAALRSHADGAVHCVFGCGGNRDQGKRPMMAEVAERGADHLVITDDNPRLEDADHIIRQILLGLDDRDRAVVERDRANAIRTAILAAQPGDIVLVAGKGHENYQDVGGQRMAFSDVAQVRLVLNERAGLQGDDTK